MHPGEVSMPRQSLPTRTIGKGFSEYFWGFAVYVLYIAKNLSPVAYVDACIQDVGMTREGLADAI
jgi:hypothetical protein